MLSGVSLGNVVEAILGEAWGGPVAVSAKEAVAERGYVHRFEVIAAPAGMPASVVAKQSNARDGGPYERGSGNWATTSFLDEWTCLQLLNEVCADPVPVPRLYGGDEQHGVLVMEDLGTGQRLDHALLGDDAAFATRTLVSLFRAVGRMHAASLGQRARFEAIASRLRRPTESTSGIAPRIAAIREALEGVAPAGSGFLDEVAGVFAARDAGDYHGVVHGDPCPDNCHWSGDGVRLLDFEHGRIDDVFTDGCYPRIHFPTCWCVSRLPVEVAQEAEEAYRRELVQAAPELAADDAFERRMTEASIRWVWVLFSAWHMPQALEGDETWGLVTIRQRILFRFGLLLDMLERNRLYPMIAEGTRRALDTLSRRWSDLAPVPLYPAYRAER